MANGTYTYDPGNIKNSGKDRMRFELGDTMVEGGSDTSALTDEEICAAIETYPRSWKRAKLMLLESLYRRFSYEVTTKTGPLTLELQERAKIWKDDYEALKKRFRHPVAVYLNLVVPFMISLHIFIQACNRMKGQVIDDKYKKDVFKTWKLIQGFYH